MKTLKPKTIIAGNQMPEDPMPKEIKEQIQSGIDRMNKIREEVLKVLEENKVRPVEMFRIGGELQATGLEQYSNVIGDYVEKKVKGE